VPGELSQRVSSLRAIAHPVRLQILSLLTGTAMSAAEVARELNISHANASYHLRVLANAGQIEPAGEQKVRGGVAKRYRHPWEARPEEEQRERGSLAAEDFLRNIHAVTDELERRSNLTAAAFEMEEES
jgi:DNA-binding transcriptional ArsR family regulator